MAWFKADDTLHSHPKARAAGLPAMGLWACAGTYSMAYKTDGHVPKWFVESWGRDALKHAQTLVDVGLWTTTDTGWTYHDWTDYQPTATEIERDRENSRARQQARRAKLGEVRTIKSQAAR